MEAYAEAAKRSGWFLQLKLILIKKRRELATTAGYSKAMFKAEYAKAIGRVEGVKSISGKKEYAVKDELYIEKVINNNEDQAALSRMDDLITTFTDAHIMYRQMLKG